MSKSNRANDPNKRTVYKLIARAGGRCQFDGCNKYLFRDDLTKEEFNMSNVAHIIPSSPNGPRGTGDLTPDVNDIDNLMLMCYDHHKMIDNDEDTYTIDVLREMKSKQEALVEITLDSINYPETKIIYFKSKTKNEVDVNMDPKQFNEAICNEKMKCGGAILTIPIISKKDYKSKEYWQETTDSIKDEINECIVKGYQRNSEMIVSIFPIAPIPQIILLGKEVGDKQNIHIFQKTRIPDTWTWQSKELTNEFNIEKKIINSKKNVAVIMSLTAEIDINRVINVFDAGIVYILKAKRLGVDSIKSLRDLGAFKDTYIEIMDKVKNEDKIKEVSLFPAIPESAAFEVGSRYMQGVYPIIHIYDEDNGFFKTIDIGGQNE